MYRERRLVVIVDESYLLSREMLEEIRFLLNYLMDSENPLALILSGRSELWDKLQTQVYRAIRHRVDVECFLTTYDYAQTNSYVEKQLAYAGRTSQLFTDEALRCIYAYSLGLPRRINRVCTQELDFAFQNGYRSYREDCTDH